MKDYSDEWGYSWFSKEMVIATGVLSVPLFATLQFIPAFWICIVPIYYKFVTTENVPTKFSRFADITAPIYALATLIIMGVLLTNIGAWLRVDNLSIFTCLITFSWKHFNSLPWPLSFFFKIWVFFPAIYIVYGIVYFSKRKLLNA